MLLKQTFTICLILSSSLLYGQLTGSGTGQDFKNPSTPSRPKKVKQNLTEVEKGLLKVECQRIYKKMAKFHFDNHNTHKNINKSSSLKLYLDSLFIIHAEELHQINKNNIKYKCNEDGPQHLHKNQYKEKHLHKQLLPELKKFQQKECSRFTKELGTAKHVDIYIKLIETISKP